VLPFEYGDPRPVRDLSPSIRGVWRLAVTAAEQQRNAATAGNASVIYRAWSGFAAWTGGRICAGGSREQFNSSREQFNSSREQFNSCHERSYPGHKSSDACCSRFSAG
jgi:hypothetical protein